MKINISSRRLEVTPALQSHVQSKLLSIQKYVPGIECVDVTISFENNIAKVELLSSFAGQSFTINEQQKDMYAAITRAAKRLRESLKERKKALQGARKGKVEEQEVLRHHEHVQEMHLV